MRPTVATWRVIQSQQDLARKNARQALLVIQQRRREQAESDEFLPLPGHLAQRTRSTRRSSHTGSGDS
jgi:hypothetical protein